MDPLLPKKSVAVLTGRLLLTPNAEYPFAGNVFRGIPLLSCRCVFDSAVVVQEHSIWFDKSIVLHIEDRSVEIDRATTADHVKERLRLTELYDINGLGLRSTACVFELDGIRLAMGWKRFRIRFAKPVLAWLQRSVRSVIAVPSLDNIADVQAFAKEYVTFSVKTAGSRRNRNLLHSALYFALSHEKRLRTDASQERFCELVNVCQTLETESNDPKNMWRSKKEEWGGLLTFVGQLFAP